MVVFKDPVCAVLTLEATGLVACTLTLVTVPAFFVKPHPLTVDSVTAEGIVTAEPYAEIWP